MIAFIDPQRGSKPVGLVAYLFGPGRFNEHTDPHIVAAAESLGVADGQRLTDREVRALGKELDAPKRLYGTEFPGGYVWHCSLSIPAEDRTLSDEEWAVVARELVDRLGFSAASGKAPCRWVAVRHGLSRAGNDHIHLVVNLIREDGTKASIWNDRRIASRVCAEFERRYGLRIVEGRTGAGMPGVSRAETEVAQRAGRPEPARLRLARIVRGCAVAAKTEAEFVRRLRRA
ncbi:relaxase/mobilization nuclease domain-containing protein, partial [Carbonactinospora thermoautotrophica]